MFHPSDYSNNVDLNEAKKYFMGDNFCICINILHKLTRQGIVKEICLYYKRQWRLAWFWGLFSIILLDFSLLPKHFLYRLQILPLKLYKRD